MRRGRSRRPQKGVYKKRTPQYKVACSVCGAEHLVPVAPPADKALTCLNCLQGAREANKENESEPQAL